MVDYRHVHECPACGNVIKLPFWHTSLYLTEVGLMIVVIVRFQLTGWQSAVLGIAVLLFIVLVQLPHVPVEG